MILLAKHSQPIADPSKPAPEWVLSTVGRRRALALAASLRVRRPARVLASPEAKARETAEIVAASLGLGVEVVDALREQERPRLPFAAAEDAFARAIAEGFRRPDEALHGGESVERARARFAGAVEEIAASAGGRPALVVTHGTVLAAYVARVVGRDPFPLWRALDLPSWLALDLDARALVASWRVTPRP